MRDVDNSDDIIDSRDVIKRIEELQDERTTLVDHLQEAKDEFTEHAAQSYEECDADRIANDAKLCVLEGQILERTATLQEWDDGTEGEELKALEALQEQAEGYADDWQHGAALIRDSYFTEYAEELLKDCGDLPKDIPGYIVIDWEKTADNIRQDYTSVEFDGVTYWVR